MIEQLYSHREVVARFELHQFIHFIGTPTLPSQSNTPQGITSGELLDAFKVNHACDLTSEIVEMFLITGGFVPAEERQTKLYLKIDVQHFSELSTGEQTKIIKWIQGPLSITLRKMMLGYTKANTKEAKENILETPLSIFMKRFIKYYCIDDRSRYGAVLSTETRASTKQLYSYYITVCASLNYTNTLGLKKFIDFLRTLGYSITKGYVRGVSGVNHVVHLHIPYEEDDLRESIQYGMGIITTKEYRITTDQMYKNYTTVALEELSKTRLWRMLDVKSNEQTTTSQTNETATQKSGEDVELLSNRTENGNNQTFGCDNQTGFYKKQGTNSETEKIHISNNSGTGSIVEKLQTEYTENKPTRTSDECGGESTRGKELSRDSVIGSPVENSTAYEYRNKNGYVPGGVGYNEDTIHPADNDSTPAKRSTSSYQRRGPVQILRHPTKPINTGTEEELGDPMAGMAELLNGAPEEAIEVVDIAAIADALKIPLLTMYGNDPRNMSREDMNKYLKLMHIDVIVDDVYDQIIEKLS